MILQSKLIMLEFGMLITRLLQAAVFFTNVTKEDTHMETIVGSHTYPNITNNGPIQMSMLTQKF